MIDEDELVICPMAVVCKYQRGCFHRTPHEYDYHCDGDSCDCYNEDSHISVKCVPYNPYGDFIKDNEFMI